MQNVRSYLFTWLRRKISHIQSRTIKERSIGKSFNLSENNDPPYEEMLIAFQDSEEKKKK